MTRSIINIADNTATRPSPCLACHWHIQKIDKNRCVKKCQRRLAYLDDLEYDHLPYPDISELQDIKEIEICAICKLEGRARLAKTRELCYSDYERWRRGLVLHPTLGEFVFVQPRKPKTANQTVKLTATRQKKKKPGGNMPKATKMSVRDNKDDIDSIVDNIVKKVEKKAKQNISQKVEQAPVKKERCPAPIKEPKSRYIKLTLNKHPKIFDYIAEVAEQTLVSQRHLIVTLLSEAIFIRKKNKL